MNESLTEKQADLPRVAHIISAIKVVLNRGEKDGLKKDQRFLIFCLGGEILDPKTKQSLGRLELIRGTGKVTHLQERMATIESDMREPGNTVKRQNPLFYGTFTEERLSPDTIRFDDPEVGDFAKPISDPIKFEP